MPLLESEKKLDFSPSLVDINRPIRKIVGTPTNRRLAMKPKLVVSMTGNGYLEKVSPAGPKSSNLSGLVIAFFSKMSSGEHFAFKTL